MPNIGRTIYNVSAGGKFARKINIFVQKKPEEVISRKVVKSEIVRAYARYLQVSPEPAVRLVIWAIYDKIIAILRFKCHYIR
jgi:hypothetical protein